MTAVHQSEKADIHTEGNVSSGINRRGTEPDVNEEQLNAQEFPAAGSPGVEKDPYLLLDRQPRNQVQHM